MNIPSLATETVRHLAPALQVLILAGTAFATEAGKQAVTGATEAAKAIWAKLKPHTGKQPALLEAAQEVAKHPDDTDAQGALRIQIRKLLEAQPQLAQELHGIIGSIQIHHETANATGTGSIAISGGMHGGTASTHVTE